MIQLSEQASNAMLDALSQFMDGGRIELMAESDRVLAILELSNPAASEAIGGELEFDDISEENSALAQGMATVARIIAADGTLVMACDIGDLNSDAVVKLNTTMIFRGGPVRLRSFKLVMP